MTSIENHPGGTAAPANRLAHDLPFDPTHGYDLDRLLKVGTPSVPADFDEFWQGLYARARAVDVAPLMRDLQTQDQLVRIYQMEFTSVDGLRIGGWLTLPADGHVTSGAVISHGYGGRDRPDPGLCPPHTAAIWPCARGLGTRSLHPHLPSLAAEHVLHGIASPDTYVHGGCAADIWCAATALLRLFPAARHHLSYIGESFGGGIGALALPWDDRFHAGALTVPSFGNHPLRLTLPCTGSGEAVRRHHADHPEISDTLAYYDAATSAARVRIPIHVVAAVFDPAVPPPGQFAIHNALAGPKELFVLTVGHFQHPKADSERAAALQAQLAFLHG